MSVSQYVIELVNISKSFGPVKANNNLSLKVKRGTIHGIIGENGAGKSTLMSILYGFYAADSGEIFINGEKANITDSQVAINAGIGMVFQHFKLVENFTVLENIILGGGGEFRLKHKLERARSELKAIEDEYGLYVDPDALIEDLGVGAQQRVEILKALYRKAEVLILDEPTGVLTPSEADQLFRILERLKNDGKTVILITHKLREIMSATDTVSVMRRGEIIATRETNETSEADLAELMVGRKVLLKTEKGPANPGKTILEIENLCVFDDDGVERVKNISLNIRAGEIVGIAGVAGNGQSELLKVLGGYFPANSGSIKINGTPIALTGPDSDARARREHAIAHVPEDRHREGMILNFHAWENMVLGYQNDEKLRKHKVFMDRDAILEDTKGKMERYDVRPADPYLLAKSFSGGNQQKIVVAREIESEPDLLLVGQPTRGVDIGAIEFIHKEIIRLRDSGKAILLVSVELDEIMSLSDRIAVMFDGYIVGEREASTTNERELGLLMAGSTEEISA